MSLPLYSTVFVGYKLSLPVERAGFVCDDKEVRTTTGMSEYAFPSKKPLGDSVGHIPVSAPPPFDPLSAPLGVFGTCDAVLLQFGRARKRSHTTPRV
jgi:hypothetical protein